MDEINLNKKISNIFKKAKHEAKLNYCLLCDKQCSSFCNSHSTPKFVLENISKNGRVLNFNAILQKFGIENGLKNAGTFQCICHKCDNEYFQDYENEENLIGEINNKILAEIALKNILIKLFKSYFSIAFDNNVKKIYYGKEICDSINSLNLKDYQFELKRCKKIIDNNLKSGYKIIYKILLPYVVPIAMQSQFVLEKDLNGNLINEIYNYNEKIKMQYLHLVIFPLKNQSLILLFRHKDDNLYKNFEKLFNRNEEKLAIINYFIFKFNEDFLIAKNLEKEVLNDINLKHLLMQTYDMPNFGYFSDFYIEINDIPNFLNEKYKLK